MALISLREAVLKFNMAIIFDRLSLQLESGERIALLGRNGARKTTLMKVAHRPDNSLTTAWLSGKGIQITHLPQEVPADIQGHCFDVVLSAALGRQRGSFDRHHHLTHCLEMNILRNYCGNDDRNQAGFYRRLGREQPG